MFLEEIKMGTEIKTNCTFREITEDEFDKLHDLFPDNEQMCFS